MDEDRVDAAVASDDELADQLRQYADALVARAEVGPDPAPVDGSVRLPGRRTPILAIAAVLVLVIGAGAWWGSRDDDGSIRSTTDDRPATTTDEAERDESDEVGGAEPVWLLPDPAAWVVTEAYAPQTSPGHDSGGAWAWRLDGDTFVLLEDVALEGLGSLDGAEVEAGEGRSMMGWIHDGRSIGFQGYGVDEARLRAVADDVQSTETGWTLPGAEPLAADPGGRSGPTESVQVDFSPLTADGVPDLSTVVSSVRRPGTEADLYRELFDASSLGQVVPLTVASGTGYVITGSFASYGVVVQDGWVWSWQTMTGEVDLAALLATLRPVPADEWDRAIAGADDAVAAAVEAAVGDLPDDGVTDPVDDPDLPRYVLPEPWTFRWVTDLGLWSAEERAQREALGSASGSGGASELVLTQGFVTAGVPADPVASLPFPVPEILVQVYRDRADVPLEPDPSEYERFSFAGLDGYLGRFVYANVGPEGGTRTEIQITASQGPFRVVIEVPFADEDVARRFAESLEIVDDDLSRGVSSTSDDVEQLIVLTDDAGNGAGLYHRWIAAFTADAGGEASLAVESLTFEQFRVELLRATTRGATFELVDGGRYLASRYESVTSVVFDEDGNPVRADDAERSERTTLLRYDPDAQILTSLDLAGTLDDARTLMDELIEVDIDDWRVLVEPYNADPLRPR